MSIFGSATGVTRSRISSIILQTSRRSTSRRTVSFKRPLVASIAATSNQYSRHLLSTKAVPDWISELQTLLPPLVEISQNKYELERHGRGESYHPTRQPDAVICPTSTEDVVTIIQYCAKHKIPIVPFGVGTSVEGHVCCVQGGISLDMKNFTNIEIPDNTSDQQLPDPIATVGAGVTRNTLNEALRHTGLQFVVDPGADATLGGMVATGASGTTAVQYGTMRENLLAVQCVLADGTIVNAGTKALKNSAGYDLLGLLCGSEGTLGVITQVTVKLHPIPEHVMAAVCVFDSLHDAAQTVAMLKLCNVPLLRCELLDATSVQAFNQYQEKLGTKITKRIEKPTLFLELQAPSKTSLQEQIEICQSICHDHGGSGFDFSGDEEERKALWAARHSLYYASIHLRHKPKSAILTDACVPLSQFAAVVQETAREVEEKGVVGPTFGHAGDGNFHTILPIGQDDSEEYIETLHEISNNTALRAIRAGGTCTGEHGVGYGKTKYLERQYGPGAVHMMKLVKKALDPHNIMNPGKVIPDD